MDMKAYPFITIERPGFIGYAIRMRSLIYLLLLTFTVCVNAETVYKTVDKEGNIIFTDKPSADSEEIKLQELQTIKNPNPAKYKEQGRAKDKSKALSYTSFTVISPENGSGLRSNNGSVNISLKLEPALQGGHKIIIALDGEEISNGSSSSASVQNLDRGMHSISASIIDGNGNKVSSTSSSFSLLRASQ